MVVIRMCGNWQLPFINGLYSWSQEGASEIQLPLKQYEVSSLISMNHYLTVRVSFACTSSHPPPLDLIHLQDGVHTLFLCPFTPIVLSPKQSSPHTSQTPDFPLAGLLIIQVCSKPLCRD